MRCGRCGRETPYGINSKKYGTLCPQCFRELYPGIAH